MPNPLVGETSPYLLQHAGNPVHWRPWGKQALALARESGRPILLSIGYSACHWCHVMAHESFEDADVAAVMNDLFINIKVDREERPDLDQIYQTAHQLLTGRPGGWPLTLFLTPDGTPFFAGTYFPKQARHGLPAFPALCRQIAEVYRNRPAAIAEQNRELREALAGLAAPAPDSTTGTLAAITAEGGRDALIASYDARHGGFGGAPKFPHATDLALLQRLGARGDSAAGTAALTTLARMAAGGIYDQLGGGFFRYSVDERWQIPHFEKMLYDNALLVGLYADAWAATGQPRFAHVVEETVAWVLREMQLPEGGFASSLDADSEGEEGRWYLWDRDEVHTLLATEEWRVAGHCLGLDGPPNFENRQWHLYLAALPADTDAGLLASARGKLLARRQARVRPGLDDKVLTAWNALMIENLAHAARICGRADWLAAAQRAFDFLLTALRPGGRLLATWRQGRAQLPAYLDDHAFLLAAAIELMQAEFRPADLATAIELARTLRADFEDPEQGGFFFTAHDHEALIQRPKPAYDNSLPAGNAVAALGLLRLGNLFGESSWSEASERTLHAMRALLAAPSAGIATLRQAFAEWCDPLPVVILRGPAEEVKSWSAKLAAARCLTLALPNGTADLPDALAKPESAGVAAWICRGTHCLPAVARFDDLLQRLQSTPGSP